MAKFAQTMKDWRRMCETFSTEDDDCCNGCPIMSLDYDVTGCDAIFSDWAKNADWRVVEAVIGMWANEHPEPVYPKWVEWLEEQGVLDKRNGLVFMQAAYEPISADIAQRLGIEPKEGK